MVATVVSGPLLVIVGETASGKSALALELAERFNGEIICADSWTVRRELTIGTAKPSAADRARVPHHLIDVVGPDEDFTAAVFKRMANQAIADCYARGKLPILVGGTGLYIDGVLFDYTFLPEGDRSARQALNELSINELLTQIEAAGLELGTVDIRNKRRLIRLIETNGAAPTRHQLRSSTLIIGLRTDQALLKERIELRVNAMLQAGLAAEVAGLAEHYGWNCEGLKGIGYREWQDYFLGSQSLEQTRQRIISSTLGLAKRQRTWFKRNKSIHWFSTPVDYTQIEDLVTTTLNK